MTYPHSTWRLIITPPAAGAWNMAIDEAILEATGTGSAPPTLRLYGWDPACLSLGYAQPIADADLDRLALAGWDLVRRPTGGRAILHVMNSPTASPGRQTNLAWPEASWKAISGSPKRSSTPYTY